MMDENETGSILIRRGQTEDRVNFTPLSGEIIYDIDTQQVFVGDAETSGGKPTFGDKIQLDDNGNITALFLRDETNRPFPAAGLIRYDANSNTLEYGDGQDFNLIASSPFDDPTNILYVSPGGKDDLTFGKKRGRTPGTAFKTLNAACREAERITKRASKGLGPYVKTITFDQGAGISVIDSITADSPYQSLAITNGSTGLDAQQELRAGFRIIGQTSGAKAIIEEYNPSSENTDELIVDIEQGEFVNGESLKFGAAIPSSPFSETLGSIPEITIFLATGIYYEDFPIKVPVNTSIKGDEFRRSIIRPKPGISLSPYTDIPFKRDNDKIGIAGNGRTFGYHYLIDNTTRIYNFSSNTGGYNQEASNIKENKNLIVDSISSYAAENYPEQNFDSNLFKQNISLVVDAIIFDLESGDHREVLHAGLSIYQTESASSSGRISAITDSISQISDIVQSVVSTEVVNEIVGSYIDGISAIVTGLFNKPKNNEDLDVLLMNDATIIRNITVQRHGGFMEVLDPEGQIKTRSPYTQTATSFSKSKAPQISFAGGMFVDGFCGNLDGDIVSIKSDREIVLANFQRQPQTPTSFFINGSRFQIDKIDTIGVTDNQFRAVLNEKTPWQDTYYQNVNEGDTLPALPVPVEILTAGNVSILSNDFTQINDLGFGLYCTNAARAEAVSVFTYYCHQAYVSEKGSEIRSLNGSCGYGDFALVAKGSDPLEIPDVVNLTENQVQVAEIITNNDFPNNEGDIQVFITGFDYEPFNTSEIEIDHSDLITSDGENIEFVRYFVTGVSQTNLENVVQLNLSSGESSEAIGLATNVPDGTPVTIRNSQLFQFSNVRNVQPTRPSTALVFQDDLDTVYRVLDYDIQNLPPNNAKLGIGQSYDYVKLNVSETAGDVVSSGQVGDSVIRLQTDLDDKETQRITNAIQNNFFYEFGYNGQIYEIIGYRDKSTTGQDFAEVDIQPALNKSFAGFINKPTLRAGRKANAAAEITVRISTLRATSHDMLDIGTGSFQDANYPKRIFGDSEKPARQENEVIEENKGRVFFATSDQDGNFRVGDFFKVDQGTGTVTFAASVALSNLDGIGFKRGVAISEFSTDDGMLDNASDSVPVESAVRQYVNRRLGIDHNLNIVSNLIGPGFIDRTGNVPMTGSLNLDSNFIQNVLDPQLTQDAATKNYVDTRTFSVNGTSTIINDNISIDTADIPENNNLYYTDTRVRNAISSIDSGGDGSFSYDNTTGVFTYTGPSAGEVRSHFSAQFPLVYTSGSGVFSWNGTTSDVPEGNQIYFTPQRSRNAISINDQGGDGSLSYDPNTGEISYIGPSASEVRSHFSGGGIVEYNPATGIINVDPITVNGESGQIELETDNVPESENATNQYFTVQRARNSVTATDAGGDGGFTYDSTTGEFVYTGPSAAEIRNHFSAAGDLTYDKTTGVFAVTVFRTADARQSISVSDSGGDGSLVYSQSNGVITYTGPTAQETRAHFSGGTGVSYDSNAGVIAIGQNVAPDSDVTFKDLIVDGNLTVNGIQSVFGSSTTEFYDVNIVLNADKTDSPGNELVRLEVERGTANNVELRWNDSIDEWQITKDGTNYDTVATLSDINTATSSGFVNSMSFNTTNGILTLTRTDGANIDQDLDGRYYTQTDLNNGQLDNRYYTQTDLNNGQLDNRYYTETQADDRFVNESGDTMTGGLSIDRGTTQGRISIDPAHIGSSDAVFRIHQDNGGYSGILLDMDNDDVDRVGGNNEFAMRVRTQDGGFDSYTNADTVFNLSSQGHLYINYGATTYALSNDPNLAVNGPSYLNGVTQVNGNILPISNQVYNIGSNSQRWDTMYANIFDGVATEAKYADLAEIYQSDQEYKIGTVVMFGGKNEITISQGFANTKVAGVISDKPAYLMNSAGSGQPVALKGRVFCYISGTASAGDLIVTSHIPGVGIASEFIGGAMIGKILKTKSTEEIGLEEILVI